MNVIVISVLLLVLLVIMVAMLGGRFYWFNQNSATCEAKGGECVGQDSCDQGYQILTSDCPHYQQGKVVENKPGGCCIPI